MAIVIPFGVSDRKILAQVDPAATRVPNGPRQEPKEKRDGK